MEKLTQELGSLATLRLLSDAYDSFHVAARSGRNDAEARAEVLDILAEWTATVLLDDAA